MQKTNPVLLVLLLVVIALVAYMKLANPQKKFSGRSYWQTATVQDVDDVPEEALLPGNKNGPVLMWAATGTNDPDVITALVVRGADANESDTGTFSGTPLSAAAGYATNPEIIERLISLGAEVNKVVGSNNKTPLIIAAELNHQPGIIKSLVENGADISYRDLTGMTALEQARRYKNTAAVKVLESYMHSAEPEVRQP